LRTKTPESPAYLFGHLPYCSDCIRELFLPFDLINNDPTVEQVLDFVARERGIDRSDETSFSAYSFPKLLQRDELLDGERCQRCTRRL
jgi:hypothetical protein